MPLENNVLVFNPCKPIKKLLEDNQKIRYLTKEEEIRLFEELPEYLKPIVLMALHTGLRRSNILNLKWESCKRAVSLGISIRQFENFGQY